jgi:hypothetical protein
MGSSFIFDGTTDDLDYGDLSVFNGATEFSMTCWGRHTTKTVTQTLIGKGTSANQQFYSYIDGSARWFNTLADGTNRRSIRWDAWDSNTSTNTWYHYGWVWNSTGSVMKLYRDGVEITSDIVNPNVGAVTSIVDSAQKLCIGNISPSGAQSMDGNIAYMNCFNRQLSEGEIKELMYKPNSIVESLSFSCSLTDTDGKDLITLTTPTKDGQATSSNDGPPVYFPKTKT